MLSFQHKADTLAQWQPTATTLAQVVPQTRFQVLPLTYDELDAAGRVGDGGLLAQSLERSQDLRSLAGVMFIDLDHFKTSTMPMTIL